MLHANHAQVLQKSVSVCKFCSAFVSQVRDLRFEEEVEKRRVLEDALHVLATEHHALECSIGAHEVTERFPKNQRISQWAICEFPRVSLSKRG